MNITAYKTCDLCHRPYLRRNHCSKFKLLQHVFNTDAPLGNKWFAYDICPDCTHEMIRFVENKQNIPEDKKISKNFPIFKSKAYFDET